MIKTFRNLTIVLSLALMFACDGDTKKMQSSGGPYEIFVVCSDDKWKSEIGDTLRAILLEPVPMLNQREPMFDVICIPPSAYSGMVLQHKNVLFIKTGSEYAEPALTAEYDLYAAPQILVSLTAPTDAQATAYVWEHRYELRTIFELAERERALALGAKFNEKKIQDEIAEKFDMKMTVPRGYKLRDSKPDFMWISYELPHASQGFMIYSYPYSGKENFSLDSLVARRNQFNALIPGPVEGSFMTTADVEPDLEHVRIDGRYWAQMRGFWDVDGDFMGGPFVSYSTVDLAARRVVTVDCYVYSPKKHKRNYLRQLETLIYSISFDEEQK